MLLHKKYARVTELTELVPLAFHVLRFKMLDAHRKSLRRGDYNQKGTGQQAVIKPQKTWAAFERSGSMV